MELQPHYLTKIKPHPDNGNGLIGIPSWLIKLARRLMILPHGRYQLILTIGQDCDWTVIELGKVESSKSD